MNFQLRRVRSSDTTLSGEFVPYNIVPLDAQSLTNAIGIFPEVGEPLVPHSLILAPLSHSGCSNYANLLLSEKYNSYFYYILFLN